jgi:hypothetical protein
MRAALLAIFSAMVAGPRSANARARIDVSLSQA